MRISPPAPGERWSVTGSGVPDPNPSHANEMRAMLDRITHDTPGMFIRSRIVRGLSTVSPRSRAVNHNHPQEDAMRTTIAVLLIAVAFMAVTPAFAQDSVLPPNANRELIEQNLIIGLQSDNPGLQRSCALMLGKIHATSARIPLMAALRNSPESNVRTAAAYALCRMGDPIGAYLVKGMATCDDCPKVRLTCAWYYENLVQPGTFDFQAPVSRMIALMIDPQ
jgi:hypothetical protein